MARVPGARRIRDRALLDTLESLDCKAYQGTVWRSVGEGRDPLTCWRSGGRWDDETFDVLYTSETRDDANAEQKFHLYQGQPLPPSRFCYQLYELKGAYIHRLTKWLKGSHFAVPMPTG